MFLQTARPFRYALVPLAALAAVYWLDRATGSDLSLFPLYLIPIVLALHRFGAAGGYLACVIAGFTWLAAELHDGSNFLQSWIPVQAMLARVFVYLLITYLLCLYGRSNRIARERLSALKQLLPLCPNCGQLLCHDGEWRSLEQIIRNPGLMGTLAGHGCSSQSRPQAAEQGGWHPCP